MAIASFPGDRGPIPLGGIIAPPLGVVLGTQSGTGHPLACRPAHEPWGTIGFSLSNVDLESRMNQGQVRLPPIPAPTLRTACQHPEPWGHQLAGLSFQPVCSPGVLAGLFLLRVAELASHPAPRAECPPLPADGGGAL